jgi:hypothetical protein
MSKFLNGENIDSEQEANQIRTSLHIADGQIHTPLDDGSTSYSTLWSSSKTSSEIVASTVDLVDQHNAHEIKTDLHISDEQIHAKLDDSLTTDSTLWSSSKIVSELQTTAADLVDQNEAHEIKTDLHISDEQLHAKLDDSLTTDSTLWSSSKTANQIATSVQSLDQSNTFNSGSNSYIMPINRALFPGQVLTDPGANGDLSWETAFIPDQDLNTDSSPIFKSLKIDDEWTFQNIGAGSLKIENTSNIFRILYQNGAMRYFRSETEKSPCTISMHKSNGSISNPKNCSLGDNIAEIEHFGYNGSYNIGASALSTATENWNSSKMGTAYAISTVDNNTNTLKRKLLVDTKGLTINDDSNSINFPTNRGNSGQILVTNSTGVLTFQNRVDSYTFETDIETPELKLAPRSTLKDTINTVLSLGKYRTTFTGQVAIRAGTGILLAAKLTQITNDLETLIFTTHTPTYGGETLVPGNYSSAAASSLTGVLTLDGGGNTEATFIFKLGGAFGTSGNSEIVLTNGTQMQNVFWVITGAVTTGVLSKFQGVIIGKAAITFAEDTKFYGRLYTNSGAIILAEDSGVNIVSPDNSPLVSLGVLADYQIFTAIGNISRTGPDYALADLYTAGGSISGFGAPYDGIYPFVIQPSVKVEFGIYNNGNLIPSSKRCIETAVFSDCFHVYSACNVVVADDMDIVVKIEVVSRQCRVSVASRNLHSVKL